MFPDGTRETDFESMDEHDPEVLMSLFKQGETVLMVCNIYPPLSSSIILEIIIICAEKRCAQ